MYWAKISVSISKIQKSTVNKNFSFVIFATMKLRHFASIFAITAIALMNACNPQSKEEKSLALIAEQEGENGNKDSLYSLYMRFAESYPQHAKSAAFLYKTADYYKMTKPEQSAMLFKDYFDKYPDSAQAANSLFNAAFMLENINAGLSIELYKKFIGKYPKDERTESAIQNLKFVGKPAEFIMENLKQSGMIQEEIDSLSKQIK